MGNLVLAGSSSGSTTITPASTGTYTITLPAETGTIQTSGAGFTTNGVAYATSTSALATGSALTFDGTNLSLGVSGTGGSRFKWVTDATANGRSWGITNGYTNAGDMVILSSSTNNDTLNTQQVQIQRDGTFVWTPAGTEKMRLTSAGTLGLGVTPSAWDTLTAFQIKNGSVYGYSTGDVSIGVNNYYGTSNFRYITSSVAAGKYTISGNQHAWYIAPSGTAGNAITFTQAMTLDSSGSLLVNTTGTNGGEKLAVLSAGWAMSAESTAGTNSSYVFFSKRNSSGIQIHFDQSGTECGNITTSGSSTTYATSSDYRLKNTIAPMTGALAKVALLKPITYKWNADGADSQGFIAHELQEIVPECVVGEKDGTREEEYEVTPAVKDEEGNITTPAVMGTRIVPVYQGIDTSFLVATLTSAIQELSALVTAQSATITSLTERITALEGK